MLITPRRPLVHFGGVSTSPPKPVKLKEKKQ